MRRLLCLLLVTGLLRAEELNVALAANGTVATADSTYTGSPDDTGGVAGPDKLIDGIIRQASEPAGSNRWHSALGAPHPHWVWLRFARPARISRVVLWRADLGSPVDFQVQTLTVGERRVRTLARRASVAFSAERPSETIDLKPLVTDNLRLLITRSSNPAFPQYSQASELQVFGEWAGEPRATKAAPLPVRSRGAMHDTPLPEGLTVSTDADAVTYRSPWLRAVFRLDQPRLSELALDATGQGRLERNLLKGSGGDVALQAWPDAVTSSSASFTVSRDGNRLRYEDLRLGDLETLGWTFTIEPRGLRLDIDRNVPREYLTGASSPLRLLFDAAVTPPSPMGRLAGRGALRFPVLLHFPDHGTLLVKASGSPAKWQFVARRPEREVQLDLVGGLREDKSQALAWQGAGRSRLSLDLNLTTVCPDQAAVDADPSLAGLKRGWLNIFAFRPDNGCLSNNSVSDTCQFCFYQYSDQARFTPPLFEGFTALDLVRSSLDAVFDGASPIYGSDSTIFMDTDPSTIIAAWNVVDGLNDRSWLRRRLSAIERYGEHILAADQDGDGLAESKRSGISGSGGNGAGEWSSNWWDVISFGWKDAYAIALDYRAFRCLADLEKRAGNPAKARRYTDAADTIARLYYGTFYNPETGILAGWRSKDGQLHDYWFLFVNGIAISYGLVPDEQAQRILDRLQAKIKEVGYRSFKYGLPGNLVPVARKDYAGGGVLGQPHLDDGSDSFQSYENGGATGSFAFHYLQALYSQGRGPEADAILNGMLEGYREGTYQNGVGSGVDWRRWDGTPCGYEGLLVDTYYALSAYMSGRKGLGLPWPKQDRS